MSTTPQHNQLAAKIVEAMKGRNYHIDVVKGSLNIVYISGMSMDGTPNANAPDQWNDLRCLISCDGPSPYMVAMWQATTEPGRYYDVVHPINRKGAAFIAFGQWRAWQRGFHHHDPHREALVQSGGPVSVARDKGKTGKRSAVIDVGYFGINQHDGQDGSTVTVGKHSAGCLVVRSRKEHAAFMAMVKGDPRYKSDPKFVFSTTIMPAEWVK